MWPLELLGSVSRVWHWEPPLVLQGWGWIHGKSPDWFIFAFLGYPSPGLSSRFAMTPPKSRISRIAPELLNLAQDSWFHGKSAISIPEWPFPAVCAEQGSHFQPLLLPALFKPFFLAAPKPGRCEVPGVSLPGGSLGQPQDAKENHLERIPESPKD